MSEKEGDFHNLIDSAYRVILEPSGYDNMMEQWDSFVSSSLDEGRQDILQMHFTRAEQMLEAMSAVDNRTRPLKTLLNGFVGPSLVFNQSFKITMANDAAKSILGQEITNLPLNTDLLLPEVLEKIEAWCLGRSGQAGSVFFARHAFAAPNNSANYIIVTRLLLPQLDMTQNSAGPQAHFLLTSGGIHFDPRTTDALKSAFSLSDAEVAIVEGLATGKSPNEVAEDRGASINTIRTQVRSALQKFEAKNIAELVGQVTGFVANFNASTSIARHFENAAPPSHLFREGEIILPSGRRMSYVDQGSINGTPVIFLHGMTFGRKLTLDATEAATIKGWRIIAPSRPGFGETDMRPPESPDALLDGVARDIVRLMDHLGIQKALVAGHLSGSCYATRLALRAPQRVSGVILISHIPIWKSEYVEELPIRQRIVAQTSIKTPPLFRFICQSGAAMIRAGMGHKFLDALVRSIPADKQAVQLPQTRDLLLEGLQHTVAQGVEGFCRDAPYTIQDWSEDLKKLKHPVTVLHGSEDFVNPLTRIEAHMHLFQDATLDVVEDAGQFLLWSHWPRFFTALNDLDKRAA